MGIFAGADIPVFGQENGGPGASWLGGIVNPKTVVEAQGVVGQNLHPEIALGRRVITDGAAVAVAGAEKTAIRSATTDEDITSTRSAGLNAARARRLHRRKRKNCLGSVDGYECLSGRKGD